jgi:hypothetical protein
VHDARSRTCAAGACGAAPRGRRCGARAAAALARRLLLLACVLACAQPAAAAAACTYTLSGSTGIYNCTGAGATQLSTTCAGCTYNVLVVAGGGGGGGVGDNKWSAGGGGAGGLLTGSFAGAGSFTVTVGAGGAGGAGQAAGARGGWSALAGTPLTLNATGGGGGGCGDVKAPTSGGSGGGVAGTISCNRVTGLCNNNVDTAFLGGTGIDGQGYNGSADGFFVSNPNIYAGTGGGGAGGAGDCGKCTANTTRYVCAASVTGNPPGCQGNNNDRPRGGDGGDGKTWSFTGSTYYAGGGGGGAFISTATGSTAVGGSGGLGGGGNGASTASSTSTCAASAPGGDATFYGGAGGGAAGAACLTSGTMVAGGDGYAGIVLVAFTCPAGTYISAASPSCLACSSPGAGQYVVTACSATADTVLASVTACAAGQRASPAAVAGSSSSAGADAVCVACASGTYSQAGDSSCASCPAGSAAAPTAGFCLVSGGYYALSGTATALAQCAAGSHCPGGGLVGVNASTAVTACAAGTASAAAGASSAAACASCTAGTFSAAAGATSCAACAPGLTSGGGATGCPMLCVHPSAPAACAGVYTFSSGTTTSGCYYGNYAVGLGASAAWLPGSSSCVDCPAATVSAGWAAPGDAAGASACVAVAVALKNATCDASSGTALTVAFSGGEQRAGVAPTAADLATAQLEADASVTVTGTVSGASCSASASESGVFVCTALTVETGYRCTAAGAAPTAVPSPPPPPPPPPRCVRVGAAARCHPHHAQR